MKPRRVILIFDEEAHHSPLSLLLRTHGYRPLLCSTDEERAAIMAREPIDLLLLGPRLRQTGERELPGPLATIFNSYHAGEGVTVVVQRKPDQSAAELLERIRVELIRKRGPKKAVASYQLPVSTAGAA